MVSIPAVEADILIKEKNINTPQNGGLAAWRLGGENREQMSI